MKIRVGDLVMATCDIEADAYGITFETRGRIGTVRKIKRSSYGVEFRGFDDGHNLELKGKEHTNSHKGLWCRRCEISKIDYGVERLLLDKEKEISLMKDRIERLKLELDTLQRDMSKNTGIEKADLYFARESSDVILPSKKPHNAGFDVYAYFKEDEMRFSPGETKLIPTGLYSCCNESYVLLGRERGSTGSIGMKLGAGVIDSSYRGEIFLAITNDNLIDLIITKSVIETIKMESCILYPYSKAVAQLLLVPVAHADAKEITVGELKSIPSSRGDGKLGSSGK